MIHRLYQEQQLNCDLQTAWTFFSAAGNLSKITPPEMKFTVLTSFANDEIYEGMLIRYRVSPLFGISINWETKITQVDYQKSFTDFQAKGPYKLWNHHHEFIPNDKGVLMKDTVDYELPFGWLGELSHNWMVKPRLDEIFRYRRQVLEKKFGHTPPI